MTLEEKFRALMKNYEAIATINKELKNQTNYLGANLVNQ